MPAIVQCRDIDQVLRYVILDWPLRQKTGKRIRTFQSHMRDNAGWNSVIEVSYYASDDVRRGTNTPLVARIRGLINTIKGGEMEATRRKLLGARLDVVI